MRKLFMLLLGFVLLLGQITAEASRIDRKYQKRVLFISSYSYSWLSIPFQIRGINSALNEKYVVNYEFMDTKNTKYSENYKEFYDLIKYKLNTREKYDGVILGDDAALVFGMKYKNELFPNIPIVFEGIDNVGNGQKAAEDPLITGIVEKVDYAENIKLAKRLFPKADRLVFILDNMENGVGIAKQLEASSTLFTDYKVKYLNSSEYSREEFQQQLQQLNDKDIVFAISMGQSKSGYIYSETDRYAMLREYAHVPMLRFTQSGVGEGLLGGYVVDHYTCGQIAGKLMDQMLSGGPKPEVVLNTPAEYYFDYNVLEKYKLLESTIPGTDEAKVTIINKPDSFVRRNASYIIGTLLFVMLLIVSYFLAKSRTSEKKMSELLLTAEKASEAKSVFLSRMSHDMRTPMNGILGLAELSATENDPQVLKNNIKQMQSSGNYLLSLINDTLDFQRIESGKMVLNPQLIYEKDLFEILMVRLKNVIQAKGIDFKVENTTNLDVYSCIDVVRLQQIYVNIISNAIKFTPAGGMILIKVDKIAETEQAVKKCISISDTGIGMSEDFIKNRLFKPFEQENSGVSTKYAGSGLGLSIVKSLAEMMGGRLEVESVLGEGTTFRLYLDFPKVDRAIAEKQLQVKQSEQSTSAEKLSGKNILLVEDHPLNAKIATKLLEKKGCKVVWVDNGAKGVENYSKAVAGAYDCILMDIRMPVLNGIEATKAIRALAKEEAHSIPIIAMTANTFDTDVKACLEAGMNAHIAKPLVPQKMYEVIAKFV